MNIINVLASRQHMQENWELILDYLKYKRLEPQLYDINKKCLKYSGDYSEVFKVYVNRTSHDACIPGSRYLHREEQVWEAIFVLKLLVGDQLMKNGDHVLDIGTENSFLPLFLAFQFPVTVYGYDLCDRGYGEWFKTNILDKCKAGLFMLDSQMDSKHGVGNVTYIQGDATNMWKFKDNSFEIITCISTIEHIYDDSKAMKEIYRVLKPGGKVLMTLPVSEEHSQVRESPDEKSWDIDRIYNIDSIVKRLIEPSGLKVYDEFHYDFDNKYKYKFYYGDDKKYYVASLVLTKD